MLSPKLAETIGGVYEPADLLKLPIISPGDPWWPQWFAAVGIHNPTLIDTKLHSYEAQDLEANAAIAGYGVAIISPFNIPKPKPKTRSNGPKSDLRDRAPSDFAIHLPNA